MGKSRILGIVGRSGSGKTTLIERLISRGKSDGIGISVIKHAKHDFNLGDNGKDTFRLREAGAKSVFITDDRRFALISDFEKPLSPVEIATYYLKGDSDLVIVEGFKLFELPKIEVIGNSGETPLYKGIENVRALVTDRKIDADLPVFKRDDIDGIYRFIMITMEL
jgi:molybdopterin-guanine dinucleotide biosynthesis adapter protein